MNMRSLRGFTLIELMIVLAIIGLLALLVLPGVMKSRAEAAMLSYTASYGPIGEVSTSCVPLELSDETLLRCTTTFSDVEKQPKRLVADCDAWSRSCTAVRPYIR